MHTNFREVNIRYELVRIMKGWSVRGLAKQSGSLLPGFVDRLLFFPEIQVSD